MGLGKEAARQDRGKSLGLGLVFDIKPYNGMWKDGLLIKLCQMGIKGKMFRWIRHFLSSRKNAVRQHHKKTSQ